MLEFFRKYGNRIRCIALAVCAAAAVIIPVLHVQKYRTLRDHGTEFKFRCGSADPYTPFLGRYIRVHLMPNQWMKSENTRKTFDRYLPLYVKFHAGKDGFAEIVSCSYDRPADMTGIWVFTPGSYYYHHSSKDNKTDFTFWRYPIERYYLNEELAKTADRKLDFQEQTCVAHVSLKDGCGIIKRLTINGEDAEKYLRKVLSEKSKKK